MPNHRKSGSVAAVAVALALSVFAVVNWPSASHPTASVSPAPAAPARLPTAAAKGGATPAVVTAAKHTRLPSLPRLLPQDPLRGLATWYGSVVHGRRTASGERFDESELTAASRTLPLGSRVRVSDPATGRSVVVRINDRGTLAPGRIIDLSSAAAAVLGILERGVARVELEIVELAHAGLKQGKKESAAAPQSAEPEPAVVAEAAPQG